MFAWTESAETLFYLLTPNLTLSYLLSWKPLTACSCESQTVKLVITPWIRSKGTFPLPEWCYLVRLNQKKLPLTSSTDLFNAAEVPESIPKSLTNFIYFDDNSFHKSLPVLPQYFILRCSNTRLIVHTLILLLWKNTEILEKSMAWSKSCSVHPHNLHPLTVQSQLTSSQDTTAKIHLYYFTNHQSTRQFLAWAVNLVELPNNKVLVTVRIPKPYRWSYLNFTWLY